MNENKRTGIPFFIVLVALIGAAFTFGIFIGGDPVETPNDTLQGNSAPGNASQATSTSAMSGVLEKAAEFNQLIASSTHGTITLDKMIVASTTAHSMSIYNATSTGALTDGTYATLITTFPTSTPQGTYEFDTEMNWGLVVKLQAGFAGDYVFTWHK